MSATNSAIPSAPFGHRLRQLWTLDPEVTFLNHGSFGATPQAVLSEQDEWRGRMERQPVRFMTSELPVALRAAAESLAAYLGTRGECIGFVDNATTATLDQHRIEVPVQVIDGALTIRLSAQVYNEPGDFAQLAEALHALAEIPAA